ncbi:hypothetical protein ABIE67_009015 [Streptomyces sp. V4I8]
MTTSDNSERQIRAGQGAADAGTFTKLHLAAQPSTTAT